ncbi:tetratricopeptide repeat protein [Luteimonas sp. MC1828]|uniref:tetratricopeptide repeat protein n=1 Tax=Luteimonas sp. MC1828 TaxID=2799787 RepID=UPI0018F15C92|nr:tetratricopeptide repeat protein [Luteimonas sp. MC1828]MBJ7575607.1 tetratricopeptide repeat protein [Luteimonas sp. MC1828]
MTGSNDHPAPADVWRFGAAMLDERVACLRVDGRAVELDRSSYDVLLELLRHAGTVVTKDALLNAGWPGRVVSENSLSKAIGRLRQALGEDGHALRAVHGYGYRLAIEVDRRPTIAVRAEAPAETPRLRSGDRRLRQEAQRAQRRVRAEAEATVREAVRRHALASGRQRRRLGMVVSMALLLGLVSTSAMYVSADRARRLAVDNAARHQAVLDFVTRDILGQADPYSGGGKPEMGLQDAIDNASRKAAHALADDPAANAAVQHMLGTIHFGHDRHAEAAAAFSRARALYAPLAPRHAEALVRAGAALCDVHRIGNRLEEAASACETAAADARANGAGLDLAALKLGQLRSEQGNDREALAILQPLLDGGAFDHERRTLGELHWALGLAARALGRYAEAERHFTAFLAIAREDGERTSWTAWAYNSLGSVLVEMGDYQRAEPMLLAARAIFTEVQGREQIEAQMPDAWRADIRLRRGEWSQAIGILDTQLRAWHPRLGPGHPLRLRAESGLAWAEAMSGNRDAASARLRAATDANGSMADGGDRTAGLRTLRWARTAVALGDDARAAGILAHFDATLRATFPAPHPLPAEADCVRAQLARARGEHGEARRSARRCETGLALFYAPSHPLRLEAASLVTAAK